MTAGEGLKKPTLRNGLSGESRDVSEEAEPGWDPSLLSNLSHAKGHSAYDNSKKDLVGTGDLLPSPPPPPPRKKGWSLWCACGAGPSSSASGKSSEGSSAKGALEDVELRDPSRNVTYSIDKVIGEGGFSKVLLVRAKDGHRREGDVYAAKIILKSHLKNAGASFVQATMLERNILGDVGHPFILKLYHSFQEKDRLVLIVDFCVGGSVHYHVNLSVKQSGKGLDEFRSRFYVAEIAVALGHLHIHGIVHRDLKLENVLLKASGHVVICDFGTSKVLRPQSNEDNSGASTSATAATSSSEGGVSDEVRESLESLVSSGSRRAASYSKLPLTTKSIIGTPAYMAPEMLLEQPYNYSVDWWALGVTFFTMLKAQLPFTGGRSNDEEKMLWRIVKSRPKYDPNWSKPTRDLLQSLLQKLPKTRICSLSSFKKAELFEDLDWSALEQEKLTPPFVPSLQDDDKTTYIPSKYSGAPLPSRRDVPYKKGDSMRKLFRDFSHRASFDKGV